MPPPRLAAKKGGGGSPVAQAHLDPANHRAIQGGGHHGAWYFF